MTCQVLSLVVLGTVLSGPVDAVGASPNATGSEFAARMVWADFDGDGLQDVYVVRPRGQDALFRNVGDGSFQDVTAQALSCVECASSEVAWQDVDLDRRPDLLRLTVAGNVALLRNRGDGVFEDVTMAAGLERVSGANAARWLDYDADGRADLELETESAPLVYHNVGDFLFEAVAFDAIGGATADDSSPVRVVPGALDKNKGSLPDAGSAPVDDPTTGSRRADAGPAAVMGPLVAKVHPDPLVVGPPPVDPLAPEPGSDLLFPPFAFRCALSVKDTSTGDCVLVSSLPTLGKLYPISANLFVSSGGDVGIGTTTPAAKLDVAGSARVTNTLTLAPSGDTALDVSTGSIYKSGLLFAHTKGVSNNTGLGREALASVTTGFSNTATGSLALRSSTGGFNNTAMGYKALYSTSISTSNTAVGGFALTANTSGSANTACGYRALFANTTGSGHTAIGRGALEVNTSGINNTATGYKALGLNGIGSNNTAHGHRALRYNTFGVSNTSIGARALFRNTTGSFNTAMGDQALLYNTTGYGNAANGASALFSNTTGFYDTANGEMALHDNTTGYRNTACGNRALHDNTTGARNTASGVRALYSNTIGSGNTASGERALEFNTTGARNIASGNRALRFNTTGAFNTASGSSALSVNTTGSDNTACGYGALYSNTTGNLNIAVGRLAGQNLTTGSDNIAIGNSGVAAESNTMRIGTSGTHTRVFVSGIRGVTTGNADAITVMIDSAGQLGTVSSSRRFKKDIADMGDATERLLELRPVVFRYNQEQELPTGDVAPEYGLIAEEVAEIFPDLVVYDEEGLPFTVKYHLLSSMLLNELQKQAHELEQQRCELTRLRGFEARLDALEVRTGPASLVTAAPADER